MNIASVLTPLHAWLSRPACPCHTSRPHPGYLEFGFVTLVILHGSPASSWRRAIRFNSRALEDFVPFKFGHRNSIARMNKSTILLLVFRLLGMPLHYYHKRIPRFLGQVIGNVLKIDYNTESASKEKFVRIAVEINLNKLVVSVLESMGQSGHECW